MSDLSERLRGDVCHTVVRECNAAADEIEAKAKRIELLEAVLVAIVNFDHDQDCLPGCDSIMHEDLCPFCNPELVMIDMAKKAIAAAEDKDDAG